MMRNYRFGLVTIVTGAVFLAACASVGSVQRGTPPPVTTKKTLATTAPVTEPMPVTSIAAEDPHQQAAELNAAFVLGSYSSPPGSVRLAAAPPGSGLGAPPSTPTTPDLVDLSKLWSTPGDMTSVIAWAKEHAPAHSTLSGMGESGSNPPGQRPPGAPGSPRINVVTMMGIAFALPTSGQALSTLQLLVSVAPDGPGTVVLRLDAQAIWVPTRPAWSFVTAKVTTVTATVWTGAGGTVPHTATSTDPGTVARLRGLVNAMFMSNDGSLS